MDYKQITVTQKNKTSFILAIVSIITSLFSIISYFLPFFSAESFFGNISMTGIEALEEAFEKSEMPESGIIYALVAVILALIMSIIGIKKRNSLVGTIFFSFLAMIMIYIGIADDMEYISSGFYFFELSSLASAITSIFSLAMKNK